MENKKIDFTTELTKSFSEVPVQMSPTRTLAKKPDKGEMLNVYGAPGTSIVEGFIQDEYNRKLSGQDGIRIFEQMRKSDAQVFATLLAMELPIRATKWSVQPAQTAEGETGDFEHEVADFVEKALFEKMEGTFDDFLREALTMLPFGFSVFEKVWTADQNNVWLKKLATRKQSSIYKWQQSDGTPGVTQILPQPAIEGVNAEMSQPSIPAAKLLMFSFRREGDNYEGVSVLRSAYKHWYLKDSMYKFDAVRHERQSVGIPVIYMPEGATPEDKTEALAIVSNIRSTEQTGIVMPGPKSAGWEFEFADTKAGQSTNLFESIKHHNREIAKNILAQFLELGDTNSGSKALSEDQSDLFLLSLGAVAKQIADTINRFLIPELVNYNFDGVENYPKIKFEKLGSVDYQKIATILSTLAGSEIIKPDEDLEDYVREMLDLPARMEAPEGSAEDTAEDISEGEDPNAEGDGGDNSEDPMNPTDPAQSEADNQSELDDLQTQLDSLQASEDESDDFEMFADLMISEMEFACDHLEDYAFEFVAKGQKMDEEKKKKISEALKKNGGSVQEVKKSLDTKISQSADQIAAAQEKFKADTAGLRSEISKLSALHDSIKKGKGTVAQRKQLAAKTSELNKKIRELRRGRDASVNPIKEVKAADLKTRKAANAIIKERKAQVTAKIKAIRQEITDGKKSLQDGIKPLKEDISANTDQMKKLRESMASLPKGSEQRDAIKGMIEGLRAENDQNRSAVKGMNTDFAGKAEVKKQEIAKTKADLSKFSDHEHSEGCGCGTIENTFFDPEFIALSQKFNNQFIIALQNECRTAEDYAKLKAKGFKFNEYEKESPRPLTFAERKVNFQSLKRSMTTFEQVLKDNVEEITAKQKEDILNQIKKAVEGNDIAAVGEIKAKYTGDLSQALTDVQKEMFEIGKKSAAVEMNVQVPPTKAEVRGAMRVQNDAIVDSMVSDMENNAKKAVSQVVNKKGGSVTATTAAEAIAAASEILDTTITKHKNALNTLGVTGSVNLGRSSIFERYPEKVFAFQYSAILDDRTTETCRSLDGRVVKAGSPEFYAYAPPRHYNCRSIWVEILQEETFKPDITGIPSSIPANQTIDSFKDIKAPIVLKGSPAIKVIQQELEDTKKKAADLEVSGKYPNRLEGYKTRIKELETSLAGQFGEYCKEILKADGINFKE